MKLDIPPERIRAGIILVAIALVLELLAQIALGQPLISLAVFALTLVAGAPRVLSTRTKTREPQDDAFDPGPPELDTQESEGEYATWFDAQTWIPASRETPGHPSDRPTDGSGAQAPATHGAADASFARTLTLAQATLQAQASTEQEIHGAIERLRRDISEIKATTKDAGADDALARRLDDIRGQLQCLVAQEATNATRESISEAIAEALAAIGTPDQAPVNDLTAAIERHRLVLVAAGAKTRDEILAAHRQLSAALDTLTTTTSHGDEALAGEIKALSTLLEKFETLRAGDAHQMADRLDRAGQQILSVLRGMRAEAIGQGQETRAADARQDDALRVITTMSSGLANRLREADARARARADRLEQAVDIMRDRLDTLTAATRAARTSVDAAAQHVNQVEHAVDKTATATLKAIGAAAYDARHDASRTREHVDDVARELAAHVTDESRTSDANIAEHIDHIGGQIDATMRSTHATLAGRLDQMRSDNARAASKLDERVGVEQTETRRHIGTLFKDAHERRLAEARAQEKRTDKHFEALRHHTDHHIDQAAKALRETLATIEDGAARREALQTGTLTTVIETARQKSENKIDATLQGLARAVRLEAAWLGSDIGARIEALDDAEGRRHINTQTVVRSTAEREHAHTRADIAALSAVLDDASTRELAQAEKLHGLTLQRLDDTHDVLATIIAAENANNRAEIASVAGRVTEHADHLRAARAADNTKLESLHEETKREIRDGVRATTLGLERIHTDLRAAALVDGRLQRDHIEATAAVTQQAVASVLQALGEVHAKTAESHDATRAQIGAGTDHIVHRLGATAADIAERLSASDGAARDRLDGMRIFIRDALARAEAREVESSAHFDARLDDILHANASGILAAQETISTSMAAHREAQRAENSNLANALAEAGAELHRKVDEAVDGAARATVSGLERVHGELRAAADADARAHQESLTAVAELTQQAVARVLETVQLAHVEATAAHTEVRAQVEASASRLLRNISTANADLAARLSASDTAARGEDSAMRRFIHDALDRVSAQDDARTTRVVGHLDHLHGESSQAFQEAREQDRARSARIDDTLTALSEYAREARHEIHAEIDTLRGGLGRVEAQVRLDASTLLAQLDRMAERAAQGRLDGRAHVDARSAELRTALRTVLADIQAVGRDALSRDVAMREHVDAARADIGHQIDRAARGQAERDAHHARRARRTTTLDRRDHARTHLQLARVEGALDLRTRGLAETLAEGLDALHGVLGEHATDAHADHAALAAMIQGARSTIEATLRSSLEAQAAADAQAHTSTHDAVARVAARLGEHRDKARREHVAVRDRLVKGEAATVGRLDQIQRDLQHGAAEIRGSLDTLGNTISTVIADTAADLLGDNAERTAELFARIDDAADATIDALGETRESFTSLRRDAAAAQRAQMRENARRFDIAEAAAAARSITAEAAADARAERTDRDMTTMRRAIEKNVTTLDENVTSVGEAVKALADASEARGMLAESRAADVSERVDAVKADVGALMAHSDRTAREAKTQRDHLAEAIQQQRADDDAREARLHDVLDRQDARRVEDNERTREVLFATIDESFDEASAEMAAIAADVRTTHAATEASGARLHATLAQHDARRAEEFAREQESFERQAQQMQAGFSTLEARFDDANAQRRADADRQHEAARALADDIRTHGEASAARDAETRTAIAAHTEHITAEVHSTAALTSAARAEAAARDARIMATADAHHEALLSKVDALIANADGRFDELAERAEEIRSRSAATADRMTARLDANTAALVRAQDETLSAVASTADEMRRNTADQAEQTRAHIDQRHAQATLAAQTDAARIRQTLETEFTAARDEAGSRLDRIDQKLAQHGRHAVETAETLLETTRSETTAVRDSIRADLADATQSITTRVDAQAEHLGGIIEASRFDPSPLVANHATLARAVSMEARLTREAIQAATRHAVESLAETTAADHARVVHDVAKAHARIEALAGAHHAGRDEMATQLAAHEARLAARVGESMRDLHASLEQAFAAHATRSEKIEATLPRLDMKLDGLMVAMDALESRVHDQTRTRDVDQASGARADRVLLEAIERLDARVDQATAGIDQHVTSVSTTLAPIAGRLDALQTQFDGLTARLDGLHAAIWARQAGQHATPRPARTAPARAIAHTISARRTQAPDPTPAVRAVAAPEPAQVPKPVPPVEPQRSQFDSLSASFSAEPAALRPSSALVALREDLARLEADLVRAGAPDAQLAARIATMRKAYRALESRFAASS